MADAVVYESWDDLVRVLIPFLVRCGAATLCGAIVGLERELKAKPAGFRTNTLICLGSAMYMTVGVLLQRETGGASIDPTRIAAQVVTGIGFLGAGCIIQDRGRVLGLTTAATIWVVAGIGIVAGAGFPILALVATVLVLLTLRVLGAFEKRFLDSARSDDSGESGTESKK
jgi:putative Mg2+ transporter-C (MgtC) family protein